MAKPTLGAEDPSPEDDFITGQTQSLPWHVARRSCSSCPRARRNFSAFTGAWPGRNFLTVRGSVGELGQATALHLVQCPCPSRKLLPGPTHCPSAFRSLRVMGCELKSGVSGHFLAIQHVRKLAACRWQSSVLELLTAGRAEPATERLARSSSSPSKDLERLTKPATDLLKHTHKHVDKLLNYIQLYSIHLNPLKPETFSRKSGKEHFQPPRPGASDEKHRLKSGALKSSCMPVSLRKRPKRFLATT